jgi:hypothetical protein
MLKTYVLGFLFGLSLLVVAVVTSSPIKQQGTKLSQDEAKLYQAELADATPVKLGLLTDKQRTHSRLYSHYKQIRGEKLISDLAAKVKDKGKIAQTMVLVGLGEALTEVETPEYYFGKIALKSDAIVRGKVIKKISQITDDDSFIFTDYDIVIAEILKDNKASHIETGATITVTRPGGKVLLGDVIVKAKDASFTPLPLNKDVLLFLKFIPETGTYRITEATGGFELEGLSFYPLTEIAFPPGVLENKGTFLQTLRGISNNSK